MPSYRELLQEAKASIEEVDARRAQELLEGEEAPLLVDVRERDEWEQGRIPGAVHVPRGHLESRIEGVAPDRSRAVLLYCAAGNRSAFAAKTLAELGYERTISLAGGYTDWQRSGFPTDLPRSLGPERATRYSRHLLIPEVGEEGQLRLLDSRILLIGAGGLGSPASLYLAAAGRRHARDRRRGRRRRDEPPAPDRPLDQLARRAEDRLGAPHDRGAEPRRRGRPRSASG